MSANRRATIFDVAKMAGVSIATVSRVLNTPSLVRPATRIKVLSAVNELDYVPRAKSSAGARKSTRRIGVLTPIFLSSAIVQRVRGITKTLFYSQYEVVVYPIDSLNRLEKYIEALTASGRLDGVIINSLPIDGKQAVLLKASGMESVLIDYCHPSFSCIEMNEEHCGGLAARHLIEKGHRRIGIVYPSQSQDFPSHPETERLKGCQKALKEADVKLPREYLCKVDMNSAEISTKLNSLLDLPSPPEAIFATSDDLAIQILGIARKRRLHMPDDLAVIGFGDIDLAEHVGLTTISQSLRQSGKIAGDLLIKCLEDPSRSVQHINLQGRVVKRDTT